MKKLFLIFFLGILFFPLVSLADGTYKANGHDAEYKGIVPCGTCIKVLGLSQDSNDIKRCGAGAEYNKYIPCQFCHFFVMFKGFVDFLLLPPNGIVFIIAVLMIVVAGIMYIFSSGNPKLVSQAMKILTSVGIGLIICLGAWVFINTFFLFIGMADWTGLQSGWFQIDCPIQLP